MDPIKHEKRNLASLVPYRPSGDTFEFYVQMRDAHAKSNPNRYGMFGGGIEGQESPLEGMQREIREELEYTSPNPVYFCRYELAREIIHVYIEEVGSDFEEGVVVHEGQYGKFLTHEATETDEAMGPSARFILRDIYKYLAENRV